MLSIANQQQLVEAGFAPTATPDCVPTGKFIAEYEDMDGQTRTVEVGTVEDMDNYIEVRHYLHGEQTARRTYSLEQGGVDIMGGTQIAHLTAN